MVRSRVCYFAKEMGSTDESFSDTVPVLKYSLRNTSRFSTIPTLLFYIPLILTSLLLNFLRPVLLSMPSCSMLLSIHSSRQKKALTSLLQVRVGDLELTFFVTLVTDSSKCTVSISSFSTSYTFLVLSGNFTEIPFRKSFMSST